MFKAFALLSCVASLLSAPLATAHPSALLEIRAAKILAGVVFESSTGRFTLTVPGGFSTPEHSTTPIETSSGTVDMHMFTSARGTGDVLLIGYVDYNDDAFSNGIEPMLDGAADGAMKNLDGKIESQNNVTLAGNPGRSLTFAGVSQGTKVYGRIDYYIARPRLYQVLYLSKNKKSVAAKDIKGTFGSFKLLDGAMFSGARGKELESDKGRFTVTIPAGYSYPEETTMPLNTAVGNLDMQVFTATKGNNAVFMVAYVDYPDEAFAKGTGTMLDGARDGAMRNLSGKVEREVHVAMDDHPGRSVTFTGKSQGMKLYGRVDYYLANKRLYQVLYLSNTKSDVQETNIQRCFASFAVAK